MYTFHYLGQIIQNKFIFHRQEVILNVHANLLSATLYIRLKLNLSPNVAYMSSR